MAEELLLRKVPTWKKEKHPDIEDWDFYGDGFNIYEQDYLDWRDE